MSLGPGTRLGPYEIVAAIGAGGMGEVYRARDTRLRREVAIKILPRAFTADADRLARFEREARMLASLNHPHIGAIYGVEDAPTEAGAPVRALVLELVEGETLADRIARAGSKGLSITETVGIARQIADALDAAHEKGIVHRDLKPANIKITPAGVVKVLDFGLAKLEAKSGEGAEGVSESPTITVNDTREGLIVGTAAYMSPEQARGQAVDKRTDIWAFACVLYEMLTGRTAFGGKTVSDTIAAILEREPEWSALPPMTPEDLIHLLERCLTKDLRLRLRDIGDARSELEVSKRRDSVAKPVATGVHSRRYWLAAVALIAIAATMGFERLARGRAESPSGPTAPRMVLAAATADGGVTADPALSNDGGLLAFASDRAGGDNFDIWLQSRAGGVPIQLTTEAVDEIEPAFSPDGTHLAYRSEREGGGIYVIPALGGQDPRLLVARGRRPRFSPDGRFIAYWEGSNVGFDPDADSYRTFVIPASGGMPRKIGGFTGARFPVWSPDGKSLLVLASREGRPLATTYDWWRVPLDDGAPVLVGVRELLGREGIAFDTGNIHPDDWRGDRVLFSDARYLWSVRLDPRTGKASEAERLTFGTNRDIQATIAGSGLIAFASVAMNSSIWALPIDPTKGVVTGAPRRLTVGTGFDARASATSDGELVAYRSTVPRASVVVRNVKTERVTDLGIPGSAFGPAISPDGTYVAYEDDNGGVSIILTKGGSSRQLCRTCALGDWSGDSRAIVVVKAENNAGRLTWTSLDGVERDIIVSPDQTVNRPFPSPNGRLLAFRRGLPTADAIIVVPLEGLEPVPPSRWIEVVAPESDARPSGWSPDGSLLYFVSGRDGTRCLYAQRVNPMRGEAIGPAFVVQHFHGPRNVFRGGGLGNVLSTGPANAIAGGFFFYDLSDLSANIWTMSGP